MTAQQKYASRVEAARLPVSRLVAVAVVGLLVVASPMDRPEAVEEGLRALGLMLAAIGTVGRLWCSVYIGGRKTCELVTAGPYGLCRNPLYLFSFIGATGVALTSQSTLIFSLVTLFLALYYPGVIRSEEAKLRVVHGAAFDQYLAVTPVLIPRRLRLRQEAPRLVDVALFRQHALEAIWFVWAVALVTLLQVLHEVALLPTLFRLP